MGQRIQRLHQLLNSPKGRNVLSFLVFLAISAVLWIVMTLNEESTHDLRCSVVITNIPDSVVQITPMPDVLNVSVRSRGTDLMKYLFSKNIRMNIDYRTYASKNRVQFNDLTLKSYFRNRLGATVQIMSVTPDSLSVWFTSSRGVRLPVRVDANVVPGPQYAIIGKIRALCDTVTLYSIKPLSPKVKSISTAPIVLNDVRSSQTLRVPVVTPPNVRAIPDSVDVLIDVEPLVAKSRMVPVTPVNVPEGHTLIAEPNEIEVYYMVPMSIYKKTDSNPHFAIQADYRHVSDDGMKVPVVLKSVPKDFVNVFVEVDSVDFILEKREP